MTELRKFLCFIRLVDPHDGLISLSNLLVIVIAVKIMVAHTPTQIDLGALLIAVGNYGHKRKINQGLGGDDDDPEPDPKPPPAVPLRAVR